MDSSAVNEGNGWVNLRCPCNTSHSVILASTVEDNGILVETTIYCTSCKEIFRFTLRREEQPNPNQREQVQHGYGESGLSIKGTK
jgi:hypothetical protein